MLYQGSSFLKFLLFLFLFYFYIFRLSFYLTGRLHIYCGFQFSASVGFLKVQANGSLFSPLCFFVSVCLFCPIMM